MAVAVAAIKALTEVVKSSQAHTMMGLEKDLKDAADSLIRYALPWIALPSHVLQGYSLGACHGL